MQLNSRALLDILYASRHSEAALVTVLESMNENPCLPPFHVHRLAASQNYATDIDLKRETTTAIHDHGIDSKQEDADRDGSSSDNK